MVYSKSTVLNYKFLKLQNQKLIHLLTCMYGQVYSIVSLYGYD